MNLRGAYDAYAPWNDVPARYRTCPLCGGQKGEYWDDEGGKSLTPEQFSRLPVEELRFWHFERCEMCDGIGEIEDETN